MGPNGLTVGQKALNGAAEGYGPQQEKKKHGGIIFLMWVKVGGATICS